MPQLGRLLVDGLDASDGDAADLAAVQAGAVDPNRRVGPKFADGGGVLLDQFLPVRGEQDAGVGVAVDRVLDEPGHG